MKIIIICIIAYLVYSALKNRSSARSTSANYAKTFAQIEREHRAFLREQEKQAREVERLEREQIKREEAHKRAEEKLAKEQERQAKILEKHEKRIQALEYKVRKINRDVDSLNETLYDYYAQLDWLQLQQAGTVTGSKEFTSLQNKIVSKSTQIRRLENKVADLQDVREQAEKELSA